MSFVLKRRVYPCPGVDVSTTQTTTKSRAGVSMPEISFVLGFREFSKEKTSPSLMTL